VQVPAAVAGHPTAPSSSSSSSSSSSTAAALEAVSDLAMAVSGEADAAHAAAAAAVVPLLGLAAAAVAATIKQGLKQLYAAAREGASVPAPVLQALTSSLRALAVPACGITVATPTAAAAAGAAGAAPGTGNKRKHAATATAEADGSKMPRLQKPPPASSDGRPGIWLDRDEFWVQLGDHIFMEVECSKKALRDPASFKVAAAAAEVAVGSDGSSSSSSSDTQHLVWLFRVEGVEDSCVHGRFYQNAERDLTQPLQLQRRTQELCSDKISSILHVLQPSAESSSSSRALETLTGVEAEWLLEVQAGLLYS
jgi:hypothetical protein